MPASLTLSSRIARHLAYALGLVAAVAVILGGACTATAGAYTRTSSGHPGAVQTPRFYGLRRDLWQPQAPAGSPDIFTYSLSQMTTSNDRFVGVALSRFIWRSSAYAGNQVATVSYGIYHRNLCNNYDTELNRCAPWLFATSAVRSVSMPAGTIGGTAGGWAAAVGSNLGGGGSLFGFRWVVTWRTPSGAFIGRKTFNYTDRGDYACLTAQCMSVAAVDGNGAYVWLKP